MSDLVACPSCSAPIAAGAAFCTRCGKPTTPHQYSASDRMRAELAAVRANEMRVAGRWILFLAAIFVLAGSWTGFQRWREGQVELSNLAVRAGGEQVEFGGETMTIDEARDSIRSEIALPFVLHYLLAALFIGIWFWSHKAPLPATVTALCAYLALQVLNTIVDPSTLTQGILLKIVCVLGLLAGIRAALDHRDAPPVY